MSEAAPDAPEYGEIGRKLFALPCEFIWAAARSDDLPPLGPPEIAFAGRSNVGKSSLLNALTNRSTLARTSNTPGRTQQLNFFVLGDRLRIVDMPGYGYAAASKQRISDWTRLMERYLRGRSSLARVYLLVDARHGMKAVDAQMMDGLDRAAVSYQVVLTKIDEAKAADLAVNTQAVAATLAARPAAFPHLIPTSSRSGAGIAELRAAVAELLDERTRQAG